MKSLQLRQDRAGIVEAMRALASSNSPADAARWKELDEKQDHLRLKIQDIETGRLEEEMAAPMTDRRSLQLPGIGNEGEGDPLARFANKDTGPRSTSEFRENFRHFLRTGQTRDYSPLGTDQAGGGQTLVATEFERTVLSKMKAISQIRQFARVVPTAVGSPMLYPTADDTSNSGHWVDENAEITNETNPTFSSITVGSHLLSSDIVRTSIQLIQDNIINLESYLATAFATRLARGSNAKYTVGNADPITGLLTALVTAGGRSVTAVGAHSNSNSAGDTALNSLGSDDLVNLISKLDISYRDGAAFSGNQATFDKLRSTKDAYGRPIWNVSLADGVGDTILGHRYFFNNDLPAIGASQISLVFGNWNYFLIRDAGPLTIARFTERYASYHQVGFEAFIRTDAKLLDSSAFAYLVHPNS